MTDPRLDRRTAWLLVAVSGGVLAVAAAVLVPWDWVPGGSLATPAPSSVFSDAEIARAESYSSFVRWWGNGSYALSLLVAAALGLTPAGARLARRVGRAVEGTLPRAAARAVTVPLVVLLVLLAGQAVTLPLGLVVRERRLAEGLTTQALGGWLGDRALSLGVSWVVGTLLVVLVTWSARRWPRRWYAAAGAVMVALVFAGSLLYPVLVEPLFNRFTALPPGDLRTSVLQLAEEEGVQVDDVLVADASRRTTTLNAYVSGLGSTRRVVLYDTLLAGATPAEVESVVAHELAHARHDDVLLGTGLGSLAALLGIGVLALVLDAARTRRRAGIGGAHDPAAAAAVLALVALGQLAASPVQSTVSRAIEARADRTALAATGDPAAFVDLQRRLAVRSLADPTPPALTRLWFGSHPTVLERIGIARSLEPSERG